MKKVIIAYPFQTSGVLVYNTTFLRQSSETVKIFITTTEDCKAYSHGIHCDPHNPQILDHLVVICGDLYKTVGINYYLSLIHI